MEKVEKLKRMTGLRNISNCSVFHQIVVNNSIFISRWRSSDFYALCVLLNILPFRETASLTRSREYPQIDKECVRGMASASSDNC